MAKKRLNEPTGFELRLLKVLWEGGPATVESIHESAGTWGPVAYTTIATVLSRMEAKGFVDRRKEGRTWIYTARIVRTDTERSLIRSLLERAFGGSAKALVLNLLKGGDLSASELADLQQLSDQVTKSKASSSRSRKTRQKTIQVDSSKTPATDNPNTTEGGPL